MNLQSETPQAPVIDRAFLVSFQTWSEATFGDRTVGHSVEGVLDHLAAEVQEVRDAPADLSEWADVLLLGFDGAYRSGATAEQILEAVHAKFRVNLARQWPDWRTVDRDSAISHVHDSK